MRFTEKDKQENHYSIKPINPDVVFDFEARIKADDKLGQLEDIEDRFNMQLTDIETTIEAFMYIKELLYLSVCEMHNLDGKIEYNLRYEDLWGSRKCMTISKKVYTTLKKVLPHESRKEVLL